MYYFQILNKLSNKKTHEAKRQDAKVRSKGYPHAFIVYLVILENIFHIKRYTQSAEEVRRNISLS